MSQIALPLAWPAAPRDDAFLLSPANARAVHLLDHWGSWPVRACVLTGPRRSGRSLLARIFHAKSGGRIIDDAERKDETEIFHAWNEAQETRRPLVIVAEALPPVWPVTLPDLRSRLLASAHAAIDPPDDALAQALLNHLFERRALDARPDLVDWLSRRVERSYLAIDRTVDLLDQDVTERRKRLSIPLARAVLADTGLIGARPDHEGP